MQANNLKVWCGLSIHFCYILSFITWLFSIPVDKGATKGKGHGYKITCNPGTKKQKCIHQAMSDK